MGKKKDEAPEQEAVDPFIGGEEDDLSDMEYIQDETTTDKVETHPPETDEEAELIAAQAEDEAKAEAKAKAQEEPKAEEVDEEVKAEAEEEPEAEEVDDEPDTIPHSRFEEVNQRMKAAEDKVRKLEKQLETVVEEKKAPPEPEPDPYDFDTKEQEAADALLEGDNEKYAALRREIRAAERDEFMREAKKLAKEGDTQLRDNMTFEEVGAKIEADYPQFVEGSDDFNPEAYDDLMDLYVGFANSGKYTRAEALERAATRTAKALNLTPTGAEPAEAPVPNDTVVSIKKTDVKGKAQAAKDQPPAMKGGDLAREEPSVNVGSMSDSQFEALPESTKRRLRGDVLG